MPERVQKLNFLGVRAGGPSGSLSPKRPRKAFGFVPLGLPVREVARSDFAIPAKKPREAVREPTKPSDSKAPGEWTAGDGTKFFPFW